MRGAIQGQLYLYLCYEYPVFTPAVLLFMHETVPKQQNSCGRMSLLHRKTSHGRLAPRPEREKRRTRDEGF